MDAGQRAYPRDRLRCGDLPDAARRQHARAYLVPDPQKDKKIDLAGWNAAYGDVFGTAANPTKTARSTVGVLALVNPDWLIEIEAFAVYPK